MTTVMITKVRTTMVMLVYMTIPNTMNYSNDETVVMMAI